MAAPSTSIHLPGITIQGEDTNTSQYHGDRSPISKRSQRPRLTINTFVHFSAGEVTGSCYLTSSYYCTDSNYQDRFPESSQGGWETSTSCQARIPLSDIGRSSLSLPNSAKGKGLGRARKSVLTVTEEHSKRNPNSTNGSPNPPFRTRSMKRQVGTKKSGQALKCHNSATSNKLITKKTASPSFRSFKWVRGELIGKGRQEHAYLTLNTKTGEIIIDKQVDISHKQVSSEESTPRMLLTQEMKLECEAILHLHHPHIVDYLDIAFEEHPPALHAILEYIPGGSMASFLRDHGAFKENTTRFFTTQILSGLEFLHSRNVVHRALKSDNVLVHTNGFCKISEIGMSKYIDDFSDGTTRATIFWMAPEVLEKTGYYDSKSDVWSAGCVTIEMWTAHRPWWDEEDNAALIKLHDMKQRPGIPTDVKMSGAASDFVDQCFRPYPNDRPGANQLLSHPYLALPEDWKFDGF